jgi:hypothetical protein
MDEPATAVVWVTKGVFFSYFRPVPRVVGHRFMHNRGEAPVIRTDPRWSASVRRVEEVVVVPGVELVAGYLFAWAVSKARRAGARANVEVDRTLDTLMDRLHELVSQKIGDDASLRQLERDAETAVLNERTSTRVQLAVAQAVEDDPEFAEQLQRVLEHLRQAGEPAEITALSAQRTGSVTQSNIGGVNLANTGTMRDVHLRQGTGREGS